MLLLLPGSLGTSFDQLLKMPYTELIAIYRPLPMLIWKTAERFTWNKVDWSALLSVMISEELFMSLRRCWASRNLQMCLMY